MATKPMDRTAFMAQAAETYEGLVREYEGTLPRHEHLLAYLMANPVEGYEVRNVIDRKDGLGPRAMDWPEGVPHPTGIDEWVHEQEAAESERVAEEAKRAEEQAAAAALAAEERAGQLAALEADQALVSAGLDSGEAPTKEMLQAVLRISVAGAQRLRG